jgi:hypothetical protein
MSVANSISQKTAHKMPFSHLRDCAAIFQPSRAAKSKKAVPIVMPIVTHFSLYDLLRLSKGQLRWEGHSLHFVDFCDEALDQMPNGSDCQTCTGLNAHDCG